MNDRDNVEKLEFPLRMLANKSNFNSPVNSTLRGRYTMAISLISVVWLKFSCTRKRSIVKSKCCPSWFVEILYSPNRKICKKDLSKQWAAVRICLVVITVPAILGKQENKNNFIWMGLSVEKRDNIFHSQFTAMVDPKIFIKRK